MNKKPERLPIKADKIPDELKTLPNWVVWKWEQRKEKWTKPPYQINGESAKSNDSATWTTFEAALEAAGNGKFDGIGFMLCRPYVGIDLDGCRDQQTGQFRDWARSIVSQFKSYTEVSPSGEGAKILLRANYQGKDHHNDRIGLFSKTRYFCITGHVLQGYGEIRACQHEIEALIKQEWPKDAGGEGVGNSHREKQEYQAPTKADLEIFEKASNAANGEKFSKLWAGEWQNDYPSQSEADVALCSLLAFWTQNPPQIDRLFRGSKLYRDKWEREDYRERTISKALSGGERYTPPKTESRPRAVGSAVTPEIILEYLNKNEDGDARLLRQVAKDQFCFDHRTGQWFKFCGHYWTIDEKAEIFDQVDHVVSLYTEEAKRQFAAAMRARKKGDDEKVDHHEALTTELGKRITRLQAKHRKENIIDLSRNGADSLGIAGTEWDSDPYALPCKNGVVDLRTGAIRPGVPADYFKIVSPAEYLGAEHGAPMWNEFLLQVFDGDPQMADFMQTTLGGSLIGKAIEHFLAIFVGKGRNGKDTMLESIRAVLGDGIASPIQSETLMSQSNVKDGSSHKADVVALRGKRLVWASETSEERKLNAEKIKLLTGGGSLHGREPYARRPITFTPTHNVFLLTNFKPKANADDYALWQRIFIVIFPLSFVDEPQGEQERKRDPHLLEKLAGESSGILSWLIKGCLRYQEQGKLIPPAKVRAAVEAYRQENDLLNLWISENCTFSGQERSGKLYENYRAWSQKNGNEYLNMTQFGKRMKEKYDSPPGRHVYYIGISLTKEDDDFEIKDRDGDEF